MKNYSELNVKVGDIITNGATNYLVIRPKTLQSIGNLFFPTYDYEEDWETLDWRVLYSAPIMEQVPMVWSGGVCPVDPNDKVGVKLSNGSYRTGKASEFNWSNDFFQIDVDILEFIVVEFYEPPKVYWADPILGTISEERTGTHTVKLVEEKE